MILARLPRAPRSQRAPRPPLVRCQCYQQGGCYCNRDEQSQELWETNVYDVVDTIGEIMKLCGLPTLKVNKALPVIARCFFHFKQEIVRIDAPRRKYFDRLDLMNELSCKAAMTRIEVQLTYSIVKRAFRAFYAVTDEYGLPDLEQLALMKHSLECQWVHAALRTAYIYASMEGMMTSVEKMFATSFKCIYSKLYSRMKKRLELLEEEAPRVRCPGEQKFGYAKDEKPIIDSTTEKVQKTLTLDCKEVIVEEEVVVDAGPRCDCPELKCECGSDYFGLRYEPVFSQGPYECFWKPDLDDVVIPDFTQADKVCTSSLGEEEQEPVCDSECFCTCSECECSCQSSGTEIYAMGEEECCCEKEDPCANLKGLLGEPEYPSEVKEDVPPAVEDVKVVKVVKKVVVKKKSETKIKKKVERIQIVSEPEPEVKEEEEEIKRPPSRPKRKPKPVDTCKRKPPCCAVCVPRKPKPQPKPQVCICDSGDDFEFPDDEIYRT